MISPIILPNSPAIVHHLLVTTARPWTVDRDDNSISRSDAMYKAAAAARGKHRHKVADECG